MIGPTIAYGQSVNNITTLDLIYIDNNNLDGKGGISSGMRADCIDLMDSLSKKSNTMYLAFLSNGFTPMISRNSNDNNVIKTSFAQTNTTYPNVMNDKAKIRELLFPKALKVNSEINLYFFLTDALIREGILRDQPATLLNMMPREIFYLSGTQGTKVNVTVFYANEPGKIIKSQLEETLNFMNTDQYTCKINYELVKVVD